MDLNDLTVNFAHLDCQAVLEDWSWLIGNSKLPILLLASGDAFVQDTDTDAVHFLDVGVCALTEVATSFDEFKSLLSDKEFVLNYFAVEMVTDLRHYGCLLNPGQFIASKYLRFLAESTS